MSEAKRGRPATERGAVGVCNETQTGDHKMYRVIYRIETGRSFRDVEVVTDHMPWMGMVVVIPDGSGRYGRVISVGKIK